MGIYNCRLTHELINPLTIIQNYNKKLRSYLEEGQINREKMIILNILIINDGFESPEIIGDLIENIFPKETNILVANNYDTAIDLLQISQDIDYCISDHNIPQGTGADIFNFINQKKLNTKFVLCSSDTRCENELYYPSGSIFFSIEKPDIKDGIEQFFRLCCSG